VAAGSTLPAEGAVLITVNDFDKGAAMKIARDLHNLGFRLLATQGTARALELIGLPVQVINKVSEGAPHILDALRSGAIDLIINTPHGKQAHVDGAVMRSAAYQYGVPILTTLSAAMAAVQGIRALKDKPLSVRSLQVHHNRS
ncbi:MAG TPA: carbamoyl phosphate synthase large subunit, partial [Spirillospora sp.]|nr:carbamoyl phosphate synthase large subunit [Spirillospora sp.]